MSRRLPIIGVGSFSFHRLVHWMTLGNVRSTRAQPLPFGDQSTGLHVPPWAFRNSRGEAPGLSYHRARCPRPGPSGPQGDKMVEAPSGGILTGADPLNSTMALFLIQVRNCSAHQLIQEPTFSRQCRSCLLAFLPCWRALIPGRRESWWPPRPHPLLRPISLDCW